VTNPCSSGRRIQSILCKVSSWAKYSCDETWLKCSNFLHLVSRCFEGVGLVGYISSGGRSPADSQNSCRQSHACSLTLSSFSDARRQRLPTRLFTKGERDVELDSLCKMIPAAWIASTRMRDPMSPLRSVV
jgi:hypothetical protein